MQARDEFARTVRDMIRLNVNERTLDVLVEGSELSRRRAAWTPPARKDERGYRALYEEHVLQAHEGCDLDFLRGRSEIVMDAVTYV